MREFGRSLLSSFWAQIIIGVLLLILAAPQLITIIRYNEYSFMRTDLLMSSLISLLGVALIGRALLMRLRTHQKIGQTTEH